MDVNKHSRLGGQGQGLSLHEPTRT